MVICLTIASIIVMKSDLKCHCYKFVELGVQLSSRVLGIKTYKSMRTVIVKTIKILEVLHSKDTVTVSCYCSLNNPPMQYRSLAYTIEVCGRKVYLCGVCFYFHYRFDELEGTVKCLLFLTELFVASFSPVTWTILNSLFTMLVLISGQINFCYYSYETCMKMP